MFDNFNATLLNFVIRFLIRTLMAQAYANAKQIIQDEGLSNPDVAQAATEELDALIAADS